MEKILLTPSKSVECLFATSASAGLAPWGLGGDGCAEPLPRVELGKRQAGKIMPFLIRG